MTDDTSAELSEPRQAAVLPPPDVLAPPDGRRYWGSMLASVVLPLVAALALVPFRNHFANAAAALVLVAVVVGVAAFGERPSGWIASVSSCVWFDFFLTRPYERLSISSAKDVETTVALVVVGFAVTEIAVRSRRHFAVGMEGTGSIPGRRDRGGAAGSRRPPASAGLPVRAAPQPRQESTAAAQR
jgi:hypothetical protein